MRILYAGTSPFAVPALRALLTSRHEVIGVVTQPDRPSGRGMQIRISPVKELALAAGLPIYQPEKVRDEAFIETVRELRPDALVVAAFGQIIPKSILDIPPDGGINVHASLLPKYRGAAPVHYALWNGEKKTGVTIMQMTPGLDAGPILLVREVEILPDEDEGNLEARLADVGADLLLLTLDCLERGEIVPEPQNDAEATLAPSVKKEDCRIRWEWSGEVIANRVRGCNPRPGAFALYQGSTVKIWSAYPTEGSGSPGEVLGVEDGILVAAGSGAVRLTEVQPENKRRMSASEFARG
ncbi:MAG: methionyl-tRNA formyltransferase, partial [Armatimonadota bacterium]